MLDFDTLFELAPPPRTVVTYAPDTFTPKPFAFVLNVAKLAGGDTLELFPSGILRRASEEEIAFTKQILRSLFGEHFTGSLWETRRPKSGAGKYVRLPRKRWRYYVIEFQGSNRDVEFLEQALTIAPCGLEVGFLLSVARLERTILPVCLYSAHRLFQSLAALSNTGSSNARTITKADAEHVGAVHAKLKAHDHGILDLKNILKLVFDLQDLPRFCPLQVLGYFAVLESLLTHAPKPDDRYDSIIRQIRQKLALLNKRWNPPLDYTAFTTQKHETVWTKMYAYRSAIAHGTTPNFTGDLAALGNATNANNLISETVRKTIHQALEEPQLLADLQAC
jgi:hypothetical protein